MRLERKRIDETSTGFDILFTLSTNSTTHREAIQYQLLPVNLHNLLHQTLCSGISTVGIKVLGYKLSLFLSLSKPLYLRWVLWLVKHQSLKEKKKVQFDKESCICGTTNHCSSNLQRSQSKNHIKPAFKF